MIRQIKNWKVDPIGCIPSYEPDEKITVNLAFLISIEPLPAELNVKYKKAYEGFSRMYMHGGQCYLIDAETRELIESDLAKKAEQ